MNAEKILFEIAVGKEYESEYDGRTYTYCAYCDCGTSESVEHDADCLMLEARKQLGDRWTEHQNQELAEQQKQEQILVDHYQHHPNHKIPCEFCGKKIWPTGMKHHQRDSVACNESRLVAA